MTSQGGTNGLGVLFQYNSATSTYTKKLDFAFVTNGDLPTSNLIEFAVNPVGINSLKKEIAVKLYPNPTHDILTLEFLSGNQKSATILIENMFGQVIYETQMTTSTHQIHTEQYAAGIYF